MSTSPWLTLLGKLHKNALHSRRVRVLAGEIAFRIPAAGPWLDVGCGDGAVGALLRERSAGVNVQGVDVHPRESCAIPCQLFDGKHLPFADASFTGCLFIDVLHHTSDPLSILRDAARVSRGFLVIKDHLCESWLDHIILKFMDWVGNRSQGVALPYAYLSLKQWQTMFAELGIRVVSQSEDVPLYPFPFNLVFGRRLHFVALLSKQT
jgi:SAM-dependent methyltransferase